MKVYKQETPEGVMEQVIFRADPDEDQATFKAAVKAWEVANGVVENWEEFFDHVALIEPGRIVLNVPEE